MNRSVLLIVLLCFCSLRSGAIENGKVTEYINAGKEYFLADKYDLAIRNFNAAIYELEKQSGDYAIQLLTCKAYLVNAYWNSCNAGKAEELIRLCERSLKAGIDPADKRLLDIYLLMAEYYLIAEYSYDFSDKCIENAHSILKREHMANDGESGRVYFLKGHSEYLKRDFENARLYLNRSVEILKNYPAFMRYECLNYIYLTYILLDIERENKKAIELAGINLIRKDLPRETGAILYYLTGWAYSNLRDTVLAEKYYNKALSEASSFNTTINNSTLYRAYYRLSLLFKKQRDIRLDYLNKALEKAILIAPTDKDVIAIYYDLANYYYNEKDYKRTLQIAQKALIAGSTSFSDTAVLKNPPINSLRQYQSLTDVLMLKAYALVRINTVNMEFVESALQCTELSTELLKRRLHYIEAENSGLSLAESSMKIFNNAVTYATHLYRYKGDIRYAEKAFYFAEKSKVQVLRINTGKPDLLRKSKIPDSLILKSERLANEILELENTIALHTSAMNKDDLTFRLTDRLAYLYDERDLLNFDFLDKYPGYRKARYDLSIPAIDDIRNVLEPDQVFVEYQLTSKQIIIFVIDKDNFYLHNQLTGDDIEDHIEKVRGHISENPSVSYNDSSFSEFIKSSHHLYNILIDPVYEKIKGKRLIIVPHGKLSVIPFEVLVSRDYKGSPDYRKPQWLIKEFPVIYAFSANFLFDNHSGKYGRRTAVFVPTYDETSESNLKKLTGTRAEAAFLKRTSGSKIFYGELANEGNFKKKSPSYRILHLATHTVVNDETPDLSCFVMDKPDDSHDDGMLHAFEIKQLKLNAKLAVLSGCNTGYGKLRLSEGFVSLARSFYYAGIRTVAFTLWSVADRSSTDIMKDFYRELNRGQSLDIAMMRSKIRFISESDPVIAHPYFWAGFIISGKAQPVMKNRIYLYTIILIIILLALIAAFIAFRKISGKAGKLSFQHRLNKNRPN